MRLTSAHRHSVRDVLARDLEQQWERDHPGARKPIGYVFQRAAGLILDREEKKLVRTGWVGPTSPKPVRVLHSRSQRMAVLKDYRR